MRAILLLLSAVILGVSGGYAWSKWPNAAPLAAAPSAASGGPEATSAEVEGSVYYANCAAAREAGKAPLYAGQPGYRAELDPEGDGFACPPG